jgi:hypothetical protein
MTKLSYKEILTKFKSAGYTLLSFDAYNKFCNYLPEKNIIMRHDVHFRDIENAYKMIEIEKELFGYNCSTYFVQLNFFGSNKSEGSYEKGYQTEYIKFIKFCLKHKISVQPHISLFANKFYSRELLLGEHLKEHQCVDCYTLEKGEEAVIINDVLDIKKCIERTKRSIKDKEEEWRRLTGKMPLVYSVHGENTGFQKFINLNLFGSIKELGLSHANNEHWIPEGLYYYNDKWIFTLFDDNLDLKADIPGSFQFLAHPKVWNCEAI